MTRFAVRSWYLPALLLAALGCTVQARGQGLSLQDFDADNGIWTGEGHIAYIDFEGGGDYDVENFTDPDPDTGEWSAEGTWEGCGTCCTGMFFWRVLDGEFQIEGDYDGDDLHITGTFEYWDGIEWTVPPGVPPIDDTLFFGVSIEAGPAITVGDIEHLTLEEPDPDSRTEIGILEPIWLCILESTFHDEDICVDPFLGNVPVNDKMGDVVWGASGFTGVFQPPNGPQTTFTPNFRTTDKHGQIVALVHDSGVRGLDGPCTVVMGLDVKVPTAIRATWLSPDIAIGTPAPTSNCDLNRYLHGLYGRGFTEHCKFPKHYCLRGRCADPNYLAIRARPARGHKAPKHNHQRLDTGNQHDRRHRLLQQFL